MKLSNTKEMMNEVTHKEMEEGFGWVYAKDRKKDPKSIPGEHWRIKFQSARDLKKHGSVKKESISKNEIRDIIKELVDEMWIAWEQEEEKNNDDNKISHKQTTNGRNIMKKEEVKRLVEELVEEIKNEDYGSVKEQKFRNLIKRIITLPTSEKDKIRLLKKKALEGLGKIKSYIGWALDYWHIDNLEKKPEKLYGAFRSIALEIDNLVEIRKTVPSLFTDDEIKKLSIIAAYSKWAMYEDNLKLYGHDKLLGVLKRIEKEITELVEKKYPRLYKVRRRHQLPLQTMITPYDRTIISEIEFEDTDHEYQEQQEKTTLKRIQSCAHWAKAHLKDRPNEIAEVIQKIVAEIDGLVSAHEKGREVSPVNITEGRCEDWPACGHGTDRYGNPDCPDRDAKGNEIWKCAGCGRKLPPKSQSSLCPKCIRRVQQASEDPTGQDLDNLFGGGY